MKNNYTENVVIPILVLLKVVRVVSNEERRKNGSTPLGSGFEVAAKFNVFNPLSYIIVFIAAIYNFVYGGIQGIGKMQNPFKWT